MFISRQRFLLDSDANIAITMAAIGAGQPEVPEFCAGTSLVPVRPQTNCATGPRPVHDLGWWKPFLQLTSPDRAVGPEDAQQLFQHKQERGTQTRSACIDHSDDDVILPPHQRSTFFSSMRSRKTATGASYQPPPAYDFEENDGAIPEAHVIAERVTAKVEFRSFPQRKARVFDA